VREVIGLINFKSALTFQPLPEDEPYRSKLDITKAEEILGWKPKVSIRKGLLRRIKMRKNNNSHLFLLIFQFLSKNCFSLKTSNHCI
jgi:nucleoside-diphosphate-sugar epimerase